MLTTRGFSVALEGLVRRRPLREGELSRHRARKYRALKDRPFVRLILKAIAYGLNHWRITSRALARQFPRNLRCRRNSCRARMQTSCWSPQRHIRFRRGALFNLTLYDSNKVQTSDLTLPVLLGSFITKATEHAWDAKIARLEKRIAKLDPKAPATNRLYMEHQLAKLRAAKLGFGFLFQTCLRLKNSREIAPWPFGGVSFELHLSLTLFGKWF